MNDENILFQIDNLCKSFGKLSVLKDITTEIKKGEVVVIIGPSGSGKSTFLRSLNLLEEPTSGTIRFEGKDITDRHANVNLYRQKIGMVFQHFNLFPHMTILRNMALAPIKLLKMPEAEANQMAMDYLKRVGLEEKANAYPNQLSGGQKQRIAIARAFLKQAPVVILDEATSALDNKSEAIVQKAIDNLMRNRTVFVIAHRLSTVQNADKIIVVNEGTIVESGTHEELMKEGSGAYKALYNAQFKKKKEVSDEK